MKTDTKILFVYDYISPTSHIPNALNFRYLDSYIRNEFDCSDSIISEINSKYSDGISVLNQNPTIPIDGTVNVGEISKFELDTIYLYNVCPFGGASCTYGYPYTLNDGFSFFHFISKKSLNFIKNIDNYYLLIDYSNEGTLDYDWLNIIYNDAIKFEIPLNKIIFSISDFNIIDNFNKWFNSQNIHVDRIHLLYANWSFAAKSKEYKKIINNEKTSFGKYSNNCSVVEKSDISKDKFRNYKFLMFNRRLRPHRIYSILYFYHMNIIDDILISYDFNNMMCFDICDNDNRRNHFSDKSELESIYKIYSDVIKTHPKKIIDYDDLENVWGFNFENKQPYLDSYIHITSETNFFETGGYFSEKTWKPIGNLQPFIMMGSYRSLEELKNLGFKTFHPFIDESYDLIENNEDRFTFIINEINRISKLPISEIHEWYHSIYDDILVHNQNLLMDYDNNLHNKINKRLKNDIFKINNNRP